MSPAAALDADLRKREALLDALDQARSEVHSAQATYEWLKGIAVSALGGDVVSRWESGQPEPVAPKVEPARTTAPALKAAEVAKPRETAHARKGSRLSPAMTGTLAAIKPGETVGPSVVAKRTDAVSEAAACFALSTLVKRGFLVKVGRGQYRRPS